MLLGTLALYGAFMSCLLVVVTGVLGARTGNPTLSRMSARALEYVTLFIVAAVLILQHALITLNFNFAYVAEYTSSTLNVFYRAGSMWAGQGGSLLLWALVVTLGSWWTVRRNRVDSLEMSPYVWVVFALVGGLFITIITFLSSPFEASAPGTTDGMGLNPLLQNPLQLIHPLALYGGYVLYTVPFAVVMGQLLAGKVEGPWTTYARTWNIASWTMLTVGIILGARWAYAELGWGGYWGWDPVENASLIPWLIGTAALHTGLTYRKPKQLKLSSVALLVTTFNLCLFGTFLTRSGVIQSVHAFGTSPLGSYLGISVAVIAVLSAAVLVWRMPELNIADPFARSHGWLMQRILTLLLLAMTAAVLWGTIYPLFARAFTGQEIAVTPGFFKVVFTPLAIMLLFLFALSPVIHGSQNRKAELIRVSIIFLGLFVGFFGATHFQQLGIAVVCSSAGIALNNVLQTAMPRISQALKNQDRPVLSAMQTGSPFISHIGLITVMVAITFNVTYASHEQNKLVLNETKTFGTQTIRLDKVQASQFADRSSFAAVTTLLKDNGQPQQVITSKLEQYKNATQIQAEVGIYTTLIRDIYVVVDEVDATPGAEFAVLSVYDNPGVLWIWIGGFLLALGGVFYGVQSVIRGISERQATGQNELNGNSHLGTTAQSIHAFFKSPLAYLIVVIIIAGVAYFMGKNSGTQNSSTSSELTSTQPEVTTSALPIDQTKVSELKAQLIEEPQNATVLRDLGNIYFTAQDYKSALEYYTKLSVLDSNDENVWIAVGACAFNLMDNSQAKDAWDRAVEINPQNPEAHYNLGFWYLGQNPPDRYAAMQSWQKVTELAPDSNFAKNIAESLQLLISASPAPMN